MTRRRNGAGAERGVDMDVVLDELRRSGLLLATDPRLPSVAGLVAGGPVRGSWWSHPKGRAIFRVLEALVDHPDVLPARLVGAKITYVHRDLWPALLAVAEERAAWQTRGLTSAGRALLARVDRAGTLRTDRIAPTARSGPRGKAGDVGRFLEDRLLVHSEQVHTEAGAHARMLEGWKHWAGRIGFRRGTMTAPQGRERLEQALAALNERFAARARLPWRAE